MATMAAKMAGMRQFSFSKKCRQKRRWIELRQGRDAEPCTGCAGLVEAGIDARVKKVIAVHRYGRCWLSPTGKGGAMRR